MKSWSATIESFCATACYVTVVVGVGEAANGSLKYDCSNKSQY